MSERGRIAELSEGRRATPKSLFMYAITRNKRVRYWLTARAACKPVEPWVIDYFNELERRDEERRLRSATKDAAPAVNASSQQEDVGVGNEPGPGAA